MTLSPYFVTFRQLANHRCTAGCAEIACRFPLEPRRRIATTSPTSSVNWAGQLGVGDGDGELPSQPLKPFATITR